MHKQAPPVEIGERVYQLVWCERVPNTNEQKLFGCKLKVIK